MYQDSHRYYAFYFRGINNSADNNNDDDDAIMRTRPTHFQKKFVEDSQASSTGISIINKLQTSGGG